MRAYQIVGGNRLAGTVTAHGAKNAVLPILSAAVLCRRTVIENCPTLSDVAVSCHILRHLGIAVDRQQSTLTLTRTDEGCRDIPVEWMRAMRSSILFLGGMLARCGLVTLSRPGGCSLGGRPIDLHLLAMRQMGAVIEEEGDTLRCAAPHGLHGAAVRLPYPSVGATENLLIAAAGTPGETAITGAAREPEITDLIAYLQGCGARIETDADGALLVQGRRELTGCRHTVLPDRIEAATYLAAAAMTGGEITVFARPEHLAAPLAALRRAGCRITADAESVSLTAPARLLGMGSIVTLPYPGFPTDLQAVFMAMAAGAHGFTSLTETVFEHRFAHVEALRRMGADITVAGRTAVVSGMPRLQGASLACPDLRAGAALVLAALAAGGQSTVTAVSHIERGYADFVPTLAGLGAAITPVEV